MTATAKDLRTFLTELQDGDPGSLIDIAANVRSRHELSAVVKELEAYGAPAVHFGSVDDGRFPVVAGLFGSKDRIARALGVPIRRCVEQAQHSVDNPVPAKQVTSGPAQDERRVGAEVDLAAFPFPVHSRADSGRYITVGVTVVRDPVTGLINTGIYRIMVRDAHTITINAAPDHDLGRMIRAAAANGGRPLEVAVAIGHHPALAIGSQLKHGPEIDSYETTLRAPRRAVGSASRPDGRPAGSRTLGDRAGRCNRHRQVDR
jgi:2,5-furandicarboxylate decarboxylase 1